MQQQLGTHGSFTSSWFPMQFLFLLGQELLERRFQFGAKPRNFGQVWDHNCDKALVEGQNDEDFLYVHFDDSLANQGGPEKGPKWHQEMAARDTSQVEKGVGNLVYDCK